ncbi:MAG: aldehyde dehydrogenase family protein [Phycisphaerales bacterium]|nr:aldehyde dehydrogenase family protein [Phycisphaerales bacterium]MCI0630356.1 aldehyde dehydrogenase family protein [Phycisphaerales bacterium]
MTDQRVAIKAAELSSPGIAIPGRQGAAPPAEGGWDYSPAPERAKVTIAPRYELFIKGKFVAPKSKKYFASINPANEDVLCELAEAGKEDVDAAVRAAKAAGPKWAALEPKERAKFLFRIARRIQERARELAVLETMDGGKPITESRDIDIPLAAQHFFYHAGWCDKLEYAFPGISNSGTGVSPVRSRKSRTRGTPVPPSPIGVCGQIIPWNFPLLMAAWKLAPALACGNTCVLKPAETTSLTALRLAEILQEIELPPGVVNIVTGAGTTGQHIVNHPQVRKIAFTGSTEVGKLILKACATSGASGGDKKLTLELGGKSPNIIFEDASIDQAIEGIVQGIYFNQGHVCCAGSRLFVAESILDEVIEKLTHRMKSLRLGEPLDKNTDIGAINSKAQLATIHRYLEVGEREGARKIVPSENGEAAPPALPSKGYWCRPCLFTDVQPSHVIAREEIFGPVLAVMSFRTPEEAITRANNTPYGLAAGVWTDKGAKMFEIARKLKAGVIWCNTFNKFDPASPFGGYKESGFGREGGVQGLRAYLNL